MSTKIYTGFRFRDRSWKTAHEHIMAFRLEMAGVVHDQESHAVADRACYVLDRQTLGLDPANKDSPFVAANMELMKATEDDRLAYDISLFPYAGRIYGITYGLPMYDELWFAKPFVEKWGYWNNTDRPEDVPGREWGVRRRTWNKILAGYASPAMSGFLAKCIAKYRDPVRLDDAMARLPTLDKRAKRIAADVVWLRQPEEVRQNPSRHWTWLRSEEGKKQIAAEMEQVRPKLVAEITKDHLNPG